MPKAITESPIELLAKAEEARQKAERSFGEFAIQSGLYLLQAKRRIPHGQWQEHVEKYTGFSLRTAEVYMRARRRYESMPAAEQRRVLEQPFTRSLLVLTQAPKPQLESGERIPRTPSAQGNAGVLREVEDFLDGHPTTDQRLDQNRAATNLVDEALEYHYTEEQGEPTPMDDILDGPPKTYPGQDEPTDEQVRADELETFRAMEAEVERLEKQNRELQRELTEARSSQGQGRTLRGWDYVEQLSQYLRADESQRTPESLARRAAAMPNGQSTISYLEMFFSATRQQLTAIA